jgi:hypothetical protein
MRQGTKAKKIKIQRAEKGIVLVAVTLFTLVLTLLGFAVLVVANSEIVLVKKDVESTRAFYLAEAGVEMFRAKLSNGINEGVPETEMGGGTCRVDFYTDDPNADSPYAIATGTFGGQTKQIKVDATFLAPPFECALFAGGFNGTTWVLQLKGTGNPVPKTGGEYSGKDKINGNIYVRGDVAMYQESCVNPPLGDNPFELEGDVDATGSIALYDTATISGDANEGASEEDPFDLIGMNYAVNNTHNVSQIFAGQTIDSRGRLPVGHPLREVFRKNPTFDRSAECASTTGDDYFFEPASGFIGGTWKTAPTPLHAGNDRIYYIDGNLWVNSKSDTYGFNMDGKVTIVVTGNIYICDNLAYADANSILGLVALGRYNDSNQLVSGGNIIFGDPTYGTMYICSAMMFAANDFMFNSKTYGTFPTEPESGFTITGCISALNRVSIERDWYTKRTWNGYSWTETRKPCRYDHASSIWVDSVSGAALSSTERDTIKHYQMIVNYDDRVRSRDTQPPMLPKGVGTIFDGLSNWEELP